MASQTTEITGRLRRAALAVLLCGVVSGCSLFAAPAHLRGNKVDPDSLAELVPGTSTRADVTALIGSPTARAAFDDSTWIYISELTQPQVGRFPAVLDQTVLVLTFNDQGVLSGIEKKTKDDSLPVQVVTRTTPSPGTEASFMQQLFGNIGRFNALGTSSPGSTSGGGAPKPY
ncbi:MAG: outer membrane protein assembly factor BamE [Acetobacteraceae bacterium]